MEELIIFPETGMHHRNRYRRNVFLARTLFERFENPARIGRPSAHAVCPSEVCLEPAVFLSEADGGLELIDALILLTRGEESQAELRMRARDGGIHLQCLAHLCDRLVVVLLPAKPHRHAYDRRWLLRVQRIECADSRQLCFRLLPAAGHAEQRGIRAVPVRVIRIELQSAAKLLLAPRPVPVVLIENGAHRHVSVCRCRIDRQCFQRGRPRFSHELGWSHRSVPRELRVAMRHLHVRRGEVGLPFDGFRQIRNRLSESLRVFFPGGSHSLEEKFIRDRIDLRVSVKPRSGFRRELRSKGFRNGRRELALKSDDVAFVALVALRPEMMIGRGVNQLRGDAHKSACAQYASFDYAIHAELMRDLRQGLRASLVRHHRCTRDHRHVSQLGEIGDQRLCHRIGEILLRRIAAEIRKRQDGDRVNGRLPAAVRPSRRDDDQRGDHDCRRDADPPQRAALRRNGRRFAARLAHFGDQPVAALRHGFDVARSVRGVAQRVAQFSHGAIETRLEIDERVRRPESLSQIVAAYQLIAMFEQEKKNLQRLLGETALLAVAAQFSRFGVEHEVADPKTSASGYGLHGWRESISI